MVMHGLETLENLRGPRGDRLSVRKVGKEEVKGDRLTVQVPQRILPNTVGYSGLPEDH